MRLKEVTRSPVLFLSQYDGITRLKRPDLGNGSAVRVNAVEIRRVYLASPRWCFLDIFAEIHISHVST